MKTNRVRSLISFVGALGFASLAWGYSFLTNDSGQNIVWPAGQISMQIKADNSIALSDGSTRATCIQTAMQLWNAQIESVQLAPQIVAAGSGVDHNGTNEIFFSGSPYGMSWDDSTLAITTIWSIGSKRTEADIIFNTLFSWDSYRGPLTPNGTIDIRRVALHELGHVLGLDHPDEHGQSVSAVMNSEVSDVDSLQSDDIAGSQALYGIHRSAPTVASQPVNQTVYVGQSAQFSVSFGGYPSPTYRWQRASAGNAVWSDLSDGGNYSGSGTVSLSISNVALVSNGDQFRCVAINALGTATSSAGVLTVSATTAPLFTTQPSAQTVLEGASVTLTAAANGTPAPNFQWQKDGVNIGGATNSTYVIPSAAASDSGSYKAIASNLAGTVTSNAAVVTVNGPPVIKVVSATRQVLNPGQNLNLSVNATGTGTLHFKWTHNGRPISGATTNTFTKAGLSLSDSGYYLVDVTDTIGTRGSTAMFVIVTPTVTQVLRWGSGEPFRVAPGFNHSISVADGLVLNADGTVQELDNYSSVPPPAGLTDIVSIISGTALKSDGTVVNWGDRSQDVPFPSGLSNVVSLATGPYHALALKADGTVTAWGWALHGITTVPAGLKDVIAIAAGGFHSLALKSDGTVVAWGYDGSGENDVPAGLSNVVSVAAGYSYSLALKADGTVVAWGDDTNGAVSSMGTTINVASVFAGGSYSLAIKGDGTAVGFGNANVGEMLPLPTGLTNIITFPSGDSQGLALRDASGDVAPSITVQPANQNSIEENKVSVSVVASGGTATLSYKWRRNGVEIAGATAATLVLPHVALRDAGQYDVVVSDYLGAAVSLGAVLTVSPVAVIKSASPVRQVLSPGQTLTLSVTAAGTGNLAFQWWHNGKLISGATGSSFARPNITAQDGGYYLVSITDNVGVRHSAPFFILIAPDQTKVFAWGADNDHEIDVPAGLNRVVSVTAGNMCSWAIKTDGSAVGWGSLGNFISGDRDIVSVTMSESGVWALKADGTVIDLERGSSIISSGDVIAVASGATSLALKTDGTVVAWGLDDNGQIAFASSLSTIIAIAASGTNMMALKADGTVVAWGDVNNHGSGQLDVPVGLTGVTAISMSIANSVALKADGTVVVWGSTELGETAVPPGLKNVTAISLSEYEVLALKKDGTVVTWGGNAVVQHNSIAPSLARTTVISTGETHSLAICDVSTGGGLPPEITTQPRSVSAHRGDSVTFVAEASGDPIPTYQWVRDGEVLKDGGGLTGTATQTLSLTNVQYSSGGNYSLVATNANGSITSESVYIGLLDPLSAPIFVNQPVSKTAHVGLSVSFSVRLDSSSTPSRCQWRKNGLNIAGATDVTYSIAAVSVDDAGIYSVVATNSVDSTVSQSATLTVDTSGAPPSFLIQPPSLGISTGYSLTFTVLVSGIPPPTYQWQKNGVAISGATGSSYSILAASAADAGTYQVVASNSFGSVTSNAAVLTVAPQVTVPSALTGDFDRDGQSDLVWQNTLTGERSFWLMNGGILKQGVGLGTFAPDWTVVAMGDFNHDGQADVVWQNTITGERSIWLMNGTALSLGVDLGVYPIDWMIVATGDFNGDGQTDLVLQNTNTGERMVWLLNGTTKTSEVSLGTVPTAWSIAAAGDFNGDGKLDLVWQNAATGERSVWLMNGTTMTSNVSLGLVAKQFQIVGTGDFNHDGKTDLVWTDTETGDRSIWLMNGLTQFATLPLARVSLEWSLGRPIFLTAQTAHADFNGDGQTDIIWQNIATGEHTIWLMNGSTKTSEGSLDAIAPNWVISGTGDFNHDEKPDLVWTNTVTGERLVWLMDGMSILSKVSLSTIPSSWMISAIGDFNYDGKPDIVWTNTATGERSIWLMNGTVFASGIALGTIPANWTIATTADLNGDGKTDIIWQNKSTGECSVWLMNGGTFTAGVALDTLPVQWSIVGSGDFNGDGKADLLLENTVTGERVIRLMNRTTYLSTISLGTFDTHWSIKN